MIKLWYKLWSMGQIQAAACFCKVLLNTALFLTLHIVYRCFCDTLAELNCWPTKHKLFTLWPFPGKVCWHGLRLSPLPWAGSCWSSRAQIRSSLLHLTLACYMSSSSFKTLNTTYLSTTLNTYLQARLLPWAPDSHTQLSNWRIHLEI